MSRSDRWDRPAKDVFKVQAEVAEGVASRLAGWRGAINGADQAAAKRKRPQDLNAYDLYLLGIEAKHRLTPESTDEAISLLTQATVKEPGLARAWTGLAYAYGSKASWSGDEKPWCTQAMAAAHRAVDLDPFDADARAALAERLGLAGDLSAAEAEFEKALALNPNSADVLTFYAAWASSFGKAEQGVAAAERAMRLDPSYPPWANQMFAYAYFMSGRYAEAIPLRLKKPRENFRPSDYAIVAASYAALGKAEEARSTVAEALARFPKLSIEGFAVLIPASAPRNGSVWSRPCVQPVSPRAQSRRSLRTNRRSAVFLSAYRANLSDQEAYFGPATRRVRPCRSGGPSRTAASVAKIDWRDAKDYRAATRNRLSRHRRHVKQPQQEDRLLLVSPTPSRSTASW